MKIAIPVKTNKENPAVTPLFGKAKWFAFVENGKTTIEKNPASGGQAVVGWLDEQGVNAILMQQMGASPYQAIREHTAIKLYHVGNERITVEDALQKLNDGTFSPVDDAKMQEIIAHHEGSHSHGDHRHQGEGHGRHQH